MIAKLAGINVPVTNKILIAEINGVGPDYAFGGNLVSQNVGAANLMNIKKVAKRRTMTQRFKVPSQIFFERNSIQVLASVPGIYKAFYHKLQVKSKMEQ